MTDKELIAACAKALGVENVFPWNPLERDEQAMALVKRFYIVIERERDGILFGVTLLSPRVEGRMQKTQVARNADNLNRAICECVAKMVEAKK